MPLLPLTCVSDEAVPVAGLEHIDAAGAWRNCFSRRRGSPRRRAGRSCGLSRRPPLDGFAGRRRVCAVPSALPAKRRRSVALEGTTQLKGSTSDACARDRRRRTEGQPQKAQRLTTTTSKMAPELNKPELKAKLRATRVAVEQLQHRVNDALERQKPSPLTREGAAAPAKLRKRRSLKGHFGKVVSVSWLPDSNRLATAAQDGNVIIWHAPTGKKAQLLPLKNQWAMFAACAQDSSRLCATGGLDNVHGLDLT